MIRYVTYFLNNPWYLSVVRGTLSVLSKLLKKEFPKTLISSRWFYTNSANINYFCQIVLNISRGEKSEQIRPNTLVLFGNRYCWDIPKQCLISNVGTVHPLAITKKDLRKIYNEKTGSELKVAWEFGRGLWILNDLISLEVSKPEGDKSYEEIIVRIDEWRLIVNQKNSGYDYPMENALRLICTIFIYQYFVRSDFVVTDHFLKSIQAQIRKLTTDVIFDIELSIQPGNHYHTQLFAIKLAGEFFNSMFIRLVFNLYNSVVSNSIFDQFLDDGGSIEGSVGYNRFMVELLLIDFVIFSNSWQAELHLHSPLRQKFKNIIMFCNEFAVPLKNNLGDCDGSHLLPSTSVMAKLGQFVDGDVLGSALCEDEMSSVKTRRVIVADKFGLSKVSFPNLKVAFFYRMFSDSFYGKGGHSRDDSLAIWLSIDNELVVGSLGTPCYSGDLQKLASYKSQNCQSRPILKNSLIGQSDGPWRMSNRSHYDFHVDNEVTKDVQLSVSHSCKDGSYRVSRVINITECDTFLRINISDMMKSVEPDKFCVITHILNGLDVEEKTDFLLNKNIIQINDRITIRFDRKNRLDVSEVKFYPTFQREMSAKTVTLSSYSEPMLENWNIDWSIYVKKS